MLLGKVHPQGLFGTAGVFDLAGKCGTTVTSVFPLHFNSGMFVSTWCESYQTLWSFWLKLEN